MLSDPGSVLPPDFLPQGNEALHVELRQRVIAHMRENEEMFAPFVEVRVVPYAAITYPLLEVRAARHAATANS